MEWIGKRFCHLSEFDHNMKMISFTKAGMFNCLLKVFDFISKFFVAMKVFNI